MSGAPRTATDDALARTRTRLTWTLFATNALSSTAFIAVVTVASIIAEDLAGSATLAGIPATAATAGSAAGALLLGALGARIGRRPSFTLGWAVATAGTVGAAAATLAGSFLGFVASLAVLGLGRSASQLARYAAGDLQVAARRGRAISLVVWAATIGSVVGPLLIGPAGARALAAGLPEPVGPVALGAGVFVLVTLVAFLGLRPEPLTLAVSDEADGTGVDAGPGPSPTTDRVRLRTLARRPNVRLSLVVLITSQLVMVLVMTMTPVHLRAASAGLGTVGQVMMAHTLGMFALAPVTGALVDRVGARRLMPAGGALLLTSCLLAATAAGDDVTVLLVALFLLGYGWNLGFVAASTQLQEGLTVTERARVQGAADATTWLAGGVGSAVSGAVVAAGSYAALGLTGAVLSLAVFAALALLRPSDG